MMKISRFSNLMAAGVILCAVCPTSAPAAEIPDPPLYDMVVNIQADGNNIDQHLSLTEAIAISNGTLMNGLTEGEAAQLPGCATSCSAGWCDITGGCGAGIADMIIFDASLSTITLSSNGLPAIQDGRTTIIGPCESSLLKIDALAISSGSTFTIEADDNMISCLAIYNSHPEYADIEVKSGRQNIVAYNSIGYPGTGTCNTLARQGAFGVDIGTADGSSLPGEEPIFVVSNTIGCHSRSGIYIHGVEGARIGVWQDGTVAGNTIGLKTSGSSLPNGEDGIRIGAGTTTSDYNQIIGNTISGSGLSGIYIYGGSNQTIVMTNTIGLDPNGHTAVPNGWDGISIENSDGTYIKANTISGNNHYGIQLSNSSHSHVIVNRIGADKLTDDIIPNLYAGVALYNGSNINNIGGPEPALNPEEPADLAFQYILGNGWQGVLIQDSSTNLVGSFNLIASNEGAGVSVTGSSANENTILPFLIIRNGSIPIDLGNDGFTLNDSDDSDSGPNNLLNYPVITSASGTILNGTVCSGCMVHLFWASGDPASPGGGGGLYLGSVTAIGTNWTADLNAFPQSAGKNASYVTLVAEQAGTARGLTSEMGPRPQVFLPVIIR